MKKKYTAPETAIIKAEAESILAASIRIGSYRSEKSKDLEVIRNSYLFSDKGIQYWVSTVQPETAKDHDDDLWDDDDDK